MDGRAVVGITLELGGQGKQVERLVLIFLGGVAWRKQLHDFGDPLTVELRIVGSFRWGAQVLLELDGKTGVVPHRKKRVGFHIDDVFLGLQAGLEHRLTADGQIIGGAGEGVPLLVLLAGLVDRLCIGTRMKHGTAE